VGSPVRFFLIARPEESPFEVATSTSVMRCGGRELGVSPAVAASV